MTCKLLEGVPIAKTLAVKTLSQCSSTVKRIQFTPDLLPADVIGTLIYSPNQGEFSTKKSDFHEFTSADEINREFAKVQSALLEGSKKGKLRLREDLSASSSFFGISYRKPHRP